MRCVILALTCCAISGLKVKVGSDGVCLRTSDMLVTRLRRSTEVSGRLESTNCSDTSVLCRAVDWSDQ
eukprot:6175166-Pleurochrysis_carterae.AAC.4